MHTQFLARLAVAALKRNRARSLLTMLGIIIGVASVITMVALGNGATASVQSQIASLGTNVVSVYGGSANQGGVRGGISTLPTLTFEDLKAVGRECPSVQWTSPIVRRAGQAVYSDQNWNTTIQGVDLDYLPIRDWNVTEGDFFTDVDVRQSAKVCVIGTTVRANLYYDGNPVGTIVRFNNVPLQVLGVLESKGQTSFGQDQDDVILAPWMTVANRIARTDRIDSITASAVSANAVDSATAEMTALLRQRHNIRDPKDDDFTIRSQQDIANTARAMTFTLTLLLGGIASVSLLVGGIGIMNIMLVSVTERIREIGLRMAVGAHSKDILAQFFVEALALSLAGGVLGILLGYILSMAIGRFSPIQPDVSTLSIILAFGCSAGVGLFFGFYPAWSASRLDPIEALRHE